MYFPDPVLPTHLGHFALAALHGLGQLLELGADFAQGDRRLQVSISPLQLIEFRWQIHAHHANLLLQTVSGQGSHFSGARSEVKENISSKNAF